MSFQIKYDRQIERMAIVCAEKWEALALLFASKGIRRFPIEYFPLSAIDQARAWLLSNAATSTIQPGATPGERLTKHQP